MKAAELRDLAVDELGAKEREMADQLFRMRIQKSMGQLEAPDKFRTVRRDLARIKTLLRQKRRSRACGHRVDAGEAEARHDVQFALSEAQRR